MSLFGLAANANHPQTDTGRTIAFDHVKGNEWWVEVTLSGQDAGSVTKVEAMDTAGGWVTLTKRSWGPYAASFHIEPGHDVRFRASWAGGAQQVSCWFSHPAGAERCGATGTFDAAFTGVRGNEWWVQAQVSTNGPTLATVDVRLDGGPWMPVAKQSWGWGSSYHIAQGTIVQLRATATDGQTDFSSCRQWIPPSGKDATIVACDGMPPPGFDATFSGVKGNEWWVQVNVGANQPLLGVAVRIGCSLHWEDLIKQSWGGWARSLHIPAGSKVDFQARATTLDSEASGGYTWTSATPTSGCPQGNWPRQGSMFAYHLDSGVCGGGNCYNTEATVRGTYDHFTWRTGCVGKDTAFLADGTQTEETWTSDNFGLPPSWLTPRTTIGAEHRPDMYQAHYGQHSCSLGSISSPVIVEGQVDHATGLTDANGDPVILRAWDADSTNETDNFWNARWDTKVGMVLDIDSFPRRSQQGSSSMTLIETNAPLR